MYDLFGKMNADITVFFTQADATVKQLKETNK
jgi:hypothetical protein